MKTLRLLCYTAIALAATAAAVFMGFVFLHTPNGNDAYFYAAFMNENTEGMREALESGAQMDSSDYYVSVVLYGPIRRSDNQRRIEMLRLLIEHGANVNACGNKRPPILMAAGMHQCTREYFDLLAAAGADLKATDENGAGYLIYAARSGCPALLKEAIDNGLDVNKRYHLKDWGCGVTLLRVATAGGNTEAVRMLIDAGANVNDTNDGQPSLLMLADAETATILLKAGADPTLRDAQGHADIDELRSDEPHEGVVAALIAAGYDASPNAAWQVLEGLVILDAREALAKALSMRGQLDGEALPSEEACYLQTALETALHLGRTECARLLMECDALEIPAEALAESVQQYDDAELVRLLVSAGCKVNDTVTFHGISPRSATPLCYALEAKKLQAARALIAAGATPNPPKEKGVPHPLSVAAYTGDPAVVQVLKEAGVQMDEETAMLFLAAASSMDTALFRQMLQELPAEGQQDLLDGALFCAAGEGTADTVKQLLERGAKPGAIPALAAAAERPDDGQRDDVIDLLLAAGADPNGRVGGFPRTPLQVACQQAFPPTKVIEKLLAAGADATVISEDGHSLYGLSVWGRSHSGKFERLLYDHGARRTFAEKWQSACDTIDRWLRW